MSGTRGWLLLLALAFPLLAAADPGRAASGQYGIDIVAIDLAGRQTNLTRDPAIDVNPAVARDGRIAFFSTRDGEGDLYVMDRDGSHVRRLTNGALDHSGCGFGGRPGVELRVVAPRGNSIAFDGKYPATASPPCEQHCAGWDVLLIGSDGSVLEQFALGARAPAWSPDGRRLAYESDIDAYYGAGSVTLARLDGSVSVRLKALNTESSPVWSPTVASSRSRHAPPRRRPHGSTPSARTARASDGWRKVRSRPGRRTGGGLPSSTAPGWSRSARMATTSGASRARTSSSSAWPGRPTAACSPTWRALRPTPTAGCPAGYRWRSSAPMASGCSSPARR